MNASPHALLTGRHVGVVALVLIIMAFHPSVANESSIPTAKPGDTIDEVVSKLGRPRGMIERKNRITYSYDRGMVNFIDGRVVFSFLVTPEEAEQRRIKQEQATEATRQQAEQQHQRLLAESQAERHRQTNDLTFAKRPAPERLAYWENFQRRYPFADVGSDLRAARDAVEAEASLHQAKDELMTVSARIEAIKARRTELDADYAASLANWKRNEITAERARLAAEMEALLQRTVELREAAAAVTTNAAAAATSTR